VIEGTSFDDNTFDIVHVRVMLLAVRSPGMLHLVHQMLTSRQILDFPALLAEVARILRPGGLFLSAEFSWFSQLDLEDPVPLSVYVPAFTRWIDDNASTIRNTDTMTIAEAVTMRVRASGLFKDDVSVVQTVCFFYTSRLAVSDPAS
jgi:SAM-dependent methyltransferase